MYIFEFEEHEKCCIRLFAIQPVHTLRFYTYVLLFENLFSAVSETFKKILNY